jgi:hypothetical protein
VSEHRAWCAACPWRDLARMVADGQQYAIDHAKKEPDSFVCHTRMGPCDGPRIARVVPRRTSVQGARKQEVTG